MMDNNGMATKGSSKLKVFISFPLKDNAVFCFIKLQQPQKNIERIMEDEIDSYKKVNRKLRV